MTVLSFLAHVLASILAADALAMLKSTTLQTEQGEYYNQPLSNTDDVAYAARIKLGGQEMDAVLDTGSFDLEIMSKRCGESCNGAGASQYYNRDKSNSYAEGDLLQLTSYESGDVLSHSGSDVVKMGPLTIDNQSFWEVVYAEMDILSYGDFEAILGVGPPGVDQDEIDAQADLASDMTRKMEKLGFKVPDGFDGERYRKELPKQQSILENLRTTSFSICLEQAAGANGHFIWNDNSLTTHADLFRNVPVMGKYTWSSKLSGVKLHAEGDEGFKGCDNGCAAIIDSGTSLIMLPTDLYTDIFDYLKTLNANCDGLDRLPNLDFHLGGLDFTLPPSAYIGIVDESAAAAFTETETFGFSKANAFENLSGHSGQCQLLLGKIDVRTQAGQMWILGMPFFRSYYVNFELGDSMRDRNVRKMTMASASSGCVPTSGGSLESVSSSVARKINPAKLRMPRWAIKAQKRGDIDL